MMMMNKSDSIWESLETGNAGGQPFIYKAHSSSVIPDIYVAVTFPDRKRAIALSLVKGNVPELRKWDNLNGIRIEKQPDYANPQKEWLLVILSDKEHQDIFSVVCEDLIHSVQLFKAEKDVIRELLYRFEKWQILFESRSAEGLSPAEQTGLYGELYFLRKLVLRHSDCKEQCIASWIGPDSDARDFQSHNWAVEIKASTANGQSVTISNERQLDTRFSDPLYLFHLSLQRLRNDGESLNSIADSIEDILFDTPSALRLFKLKLSAAHYFIRHRHLYETSGYDVRNAGFYHVRGNFPRIEEPELRKGVSNVSYSVSLAGCETYQVSDESAYNQINFK